jgi:hypothetical protein
MNDSRTDLEKVTAQVAGLERFLRTRLLNALTRLFLVLVLIGGTISALTPGGHFLETASICLAVALALATWFILRYLQIVRGLHTDPVREVARLHKKRTIKNAGFVDATPSCGGAPRAGRRRDSDVAETERDGAIRDVDVLGQKSDDGVNRTDDPSRGTIE